MGNRIQIETAGWLHEKIGNRFAHIELGEADSTLAYLIDTFSGQVGSWIKDLVLDDKGKCLSGSVVTIVDGQVVHRQDPSGIQLRDGSTVCFLVAVDGG